MVEKLITSPRNVIDFARYQQGRSVGKAQAIRGAPLPALRRCASRTARTKTNAPARSMSRHWRSETRRANFTRSDLNECQRRDPPGCPALSLHLLRRRRHDLGDPAVAAQGKQTLLDIAQHCVCLVTEHVGRGRREREHPARQVAHADLVTGFDPDHIGSVKPRAAEKAGEIAMGSPGADRSDHSSSSDQARRAVL